MPKGLLRTHNDTSNINGLEGDDIPHLTVTKFGAYILTRTTMATQQEQQDEHKRRQ